VGGAAAVLGVLSRRRALALAALLAALVAYGAGAGALPDVSNTWDDTFIGLVLLPATLSVAWLALPLAEWRGLIWVGLGLVAASVVLRVLGLDSAFNVTKLLALVAFGFAFVTLLEPPLGLMVAIAGIIPWVDAYSVWRGPTKVVVEEHPGVFDRISIAFRFPGEDATANLGPPDVVFFAIFLATAQRFGLRVGWTFVGMAAFLFVTLVATDAFDLNGLPALPAISLGFLAPNADLLWRRWRAWRFSQARAG
jgi:hypothetical protein